LRSRADPGKVPPMRCLLVSDLHYALKQFDWVQSVADRFDLVVIAGDHLDISGHASVDVQIVVILKYLKRLHGTTRLVVSSGNHDLNASDANGEKTARWLARAREAGIAVDGGWVEAGDASITICPWWDGPRGCAAVGEQLARDAERRRERWIWIYHAPPDESPVSWGGQKHFGDAELLGWIRHYQPDVVLTGHIHQSPFRQGGSWADRIGKTWVFNAGRQIGPCPAHVVIDTDEMTAKWFSLAGDEMVRLDQPLARPFAPVSPP
jgi:Icc-related predicted phosphoesterase